MTDAFLNLFEKVQCVSFVQGVANLGHLSSALWPLCPVFRARVIAEGYGASLSIL